MSFPATRNFLNHCALDVAITGSKRADVRDRSETKASLIIPNSEQDCSDFSSLGIFRILGRCPSQVVRVPMGWVLGSINRAELDDCA